MNVIQNENGFVTIKSRESVSAFPVHRPNRKSRDSPAQSRKFLNFNFLENPESRDYQN